MALHELGVLDTLAEPAFDAITRTAAQLCGMPIALVSLIDAQRQWFKSNFGMPGATETPRDVAFCSLRTQSTSSVRMLAGDQARAGPPTRNSASS